MIQDSAWSSPEQPGWGRWQRTHRCSHSQRLRWFLRPRGGGHHTAVRTTGALTGQQGAVCQPGRRARASLSGQWSGLNSDSCKMEFQ